MGDHEFHVGSSWTCVLQETSPVGIQYNGDVHFPRKDILTQVRYQLVPYEIIITLSERKTLMPCVFFDSSGVLTHIKKLPVHTFFDLPKFA